VVRGPIGPPPPGLLRRSQYEAGPAIVPAEFGTDQHAGSEAQLLQVEADLLEIPVVQLALQPGEQRPQPVGPEFLSIVVGDLPQLPEAGHVGLQVADRARQV
jgi:hypothetical protein